MKKPAVSTQPVSSFAGPPPSEIQISAVLLNRDVPIVASKQSTLSFMQFTFINNPNQVEDMRGAAQWILDFPESLIGVDTETTGLDPFTCQVRLIQIAVEGFCVVIDLDAFRKPGVRQVNWNNPILYYVKRILEGQKRVKVLQNGSFDLNFLWQEGINLGGELHDTMIASSIINNGCVGAKNDLGSIHRRELGKDLPKEEQRSDWSKPDLTKQQILYAAKDAECLTRIMPSLLEKLKKAQVTNHITLNDVYALEQKAQRPIARMQKNGFWFDVEKAGALRDALKLKAHELKYEFCAMLQQRLITKNPENPEKWLPQDPDGSFNTRTKDSGSVRLGTKLYKGFNPISSKQLIERFLDAGIILKPTLDPKTKEVKYSIDQNLLAFLANTEPLIKAYMDMKEANTRDIFVGKLIKAVSPDGRIHSNYRQMGTKTGRMSCSDINVQQIPREKEFRQLFQPTPGWKIIVADYSAMEARMVAEISGDSRMIEAFENKADFHKLTASLMMDVDEDKVTKEMRTAGKVCNFALLYGAGPATLQKQAVSQFKLDWSKSQAVDYCNRFRKAYPTLKRWQQDQGCATTEAVYTRYGRRRFLFGEDDKYTTRLNSPCQGSCGDIAKIAVAMLDEWLMKDDSARLICVCHDELVVEAEPEKADIWAERVVKCMEDAGNLVCVKVPIVAECGVGDDWSIK